MSSEFLEDVDNDGSAVLLTMSASGFATLTILALDCEDEQYARFPLQPNQKGLDNARKIAQALLDWAEHIQKAGLLCK